MAGGLGMRRRARPSFLVAFGLLSLVLMGVVLGQVMSSRLRHVAPGYEVARAQLR
jgi:hypothetical protein